MTGFSIPVKWKTQFAGQGIQDCVNGTNIAGKPFSFMFIRNIGKSTQVQAIIIFSE